MKYEEYLPYLKGLFLSLILTLSAYFIVAEHLLKGFLLNSIVAVLCVAQVFVQLRFFLHLGQESKPYWNLQSFFFMLIVTGIVVFGSMWVMYNLDYRMMPKM